MGNSGPNPDDFNKPTAQEYAQAETAAMMFNEYLKGKPVEAAYLTDINRDPTTTANTVKGQAAVDLALKTAQPVVNPNAAINPAGMVRAAGMRSKVMNDIGQDTISQQTAAKKAFVENAMGIQSTANSAQAGMAKEAVQRNISDAEANYDNNAAGLKSLTSLAGVGAGMARSRR